MQKEGSTKNIGKSNAKENKTPQDPQDPGSGTSNPTSTAGIQIIDPNKEVETEESNNDSIEQDQTSPSGKIKEVEGKQAATPEITPSPSYADIARKKIIDPLSSLEEEILERPAKREGRNSRREAREEEAERQKNSRKPGHNRNFNWKKHKNKASKRRNKHYSQ